MKVVGELKKSVKWGSAYYGWDRVNVGAYFGEHPPVFRAFMKFVDTYKGRSAAGFVLENEAGERFNMSMPDTLKMLQEVQEGAVTGLEGFFSSKVYAFKKAGATVLIRLAEPEEWNPVKEYDKPYSKKAIKEANDNE